MKFRYVVSMGLIITLVLFAAQVATAATIKGKVNINKATLDDLSIVPGLSKAQAKRIVRYAKKRTFKRLKDLRRVRINKRQLRKFQRYLKLKGTTDIHIAFNKPVVKKKVEPAPVVPVSQQIDDNDVDKLLKDR